MVAVKEFQASRVSENDKIMLVFILADDTLTGFPTDKRKLRRGP